MDKVYKLKRLYQQIFQCRECQNIIPSKVQRQVLENTLNSEIVLMAQAPGVCGVRISGVHWNKEDGSLIGGGIFLNNQLALIEYSVRQNNPVPRPYTTNVLQCWTGRDGDRSRDRPPAEKELETCKKYWQEELNIIQPKILVVLGKKATESLSKVIEQNWIFADMLNCKVENIPIGEIKVTVFFLPHPSAPYKERNAPYRTKSELYRDIFIKIKQKLKH